MGLLSAFATVAALAGSWEGIVLTAEWEQRARAYMRCQGIARLSGRPFLVVGIPATRWQSAFGIGRWHGCGDVCVDLNPDVLVECDTGEVADVRELPYADGHFGAALCSHVLEHMPDLESFQAAVAELYRVATHVEIVSPRRASLHAALWPGHNLWVQSWAGGARAVERRTGDSAVFDLREATWRG